MHQHSKVMDGDTSRIHGNHFFATALNPIGERQVSKEINHDRRRFLGVAVMTIAAAEL